MPPAPEHRPVVPEPYEAEGWLFERVDELWRPGALDEGHGDLFDPVVDHLVNVWGTGTTRAHLEHREHLARLDRAVIDLRITMIWARREADNAEATVAELDDEIAGLLEAAGENDRRWQEARQHQQDARRRRGGARSWRWDGRPGHRGGTSADKDIRSGEPIHRTEVDGDST